MKLIVATNNKGKVKEYKDLLLPFGYETVSLSDENIHIDIVEDGASFEENAEIKARAVFELTGLPAIADDSGLEVEYLNNAPGIRSARYCGENATDSDRCNKILSEMQGVEKSQRTARFVCSVCFIKDNSNKYSATGTIEGFIGNALMGNNGFGYDPIFIINDNVSMAMLSDNEKNKISHRAKAVNNLLQMIKTI